MTEDRNLLSGASTAGWHAWHDGTAWEMCYGRPPAGNQLKYVVECTQHEK